jgi:hypothetical protein
MFYSMRKTISHLVTREVSRNLLPVGMFVERAKRAYKWHKETSVFIRPRNLIILRLSIAIGMPRWHIGNTKPGFGSIRSQIVQPRISVRRQKSAIPAKSKKFFAALLERMTMTDRKYENMVVEMIFVHFFRLLL